MTLHHKVLYSPTTGYSQHDAFAKLIAKSHGLADVISRGPIRLCADAIAGPRVIGAPRRATSISRHTMRIFKTLTVATV